MEKQRDSVTVKLSENVMLLAYPNGHNFLEVTNLDVYGKPYIRRYKIVNKIPPGYHVWYIGNRIGVKDYIPLCTPLNGNSPRVNLNKLLAIKLPVDECKILSRAAAYGTYDLETAKTMRDKTTDKEWNRLRTRGFGKSDLDKALEILERISIIYDKEKFDGGELDDMQTIDNDKLIQHLLGGN